MAEDNQKTKSKWKSAAIFGISFVIIDIAVAVGVAIGWHMRASVTPEKPSVDRIARDILKHQGHLSDE